MRLRRVAGRENVMAQEIICDMCQAEHAVLMHTNLAEGSVLAVGPACLITYYESSLKTLTVAAKAGAAEAESPADGPAAADVAGDTIPAAPARRKPRKPAQPKEVADGETAAEQGS